MAKPTRDLSPQIVRISPRLARERRTVNLMIDLYCRTHHGAHSDALCNDCGQLAAYARARLDRCPFGENKTTCAQCHVHCYRLDMRDRIRTVMRDTGPRMLVRHPLLTIQHLWDDWRSQHRPPPTRA